MSLGKFLLFDTEIGKAKVQSILDQDRGLCPFCDYDKLEEVLAQEGEILLIKNKYPILRDTYPTVLIESTDCNAELSTYSKEHLHTLIRFGIKNWVKMMESGSYKSVVFFKNHGPNSGGTLRHPHMQIIGLQDLDYMEFGITSSNFGGITIHSQPGVELNLSTSPRIGFYEFNVVLDDFTLVDRLSDYLQATVHYLLNCFRNCDSYNLFFYRMGQSITVKIVPRFVTSPLFIGYAIPQITTRLENVAHDLQRKYFPK